VATLNAHIEFTMSASQPDCQPVLNAVPRWMVRVLAWTAFAICASLAWSAVAGDGPTSACIGGGTDCHDVQTSTWSVWLGLPVAVAGLACYASLAGLSVLAGLKSARAVRWVGTLLILLSLTAALCGLWFTGIQLFVLSKICLWCMALHSCGIAIAGTVIWGTAMRPRYVAAPGPAAPRLATPRSTNSGVPSLVMPRTSRVTPAFASSLARPAWLIAVGGALAIVVALIGGQILFPADASYQAQVALSDPVVLGETIGAKEKIEEPESTDNASQNAVPYQANRIPTDVATNAGGVSQTAAFEPTDAGAPSTAAGKDEGKVSSADSMLTAEPQASATVTTPAPKRTRLVKFLNGSVTLDIYEHPVIGNPEAPYVVLEFASYDCPHCHQMHRSVQKAMRRYGNQVAVVVLPYPQEMDCNKEIPSLKNSITGACATARMAIGVAMIDQAKFAAFHDWLMAGKDKPPTAAQVVQKAYTTMGRERMRQIPREKLQSQIAQYIDLYIKIKAKAPDPKKIGLPLLVIGDHINSGILEDEKLFKLWEEHLGVTPVADSSTGPLSIESDLEKGL